MTFADAGPAHLLAGKGYDGDAIRAYLLAEHICPVILPSLHRNAVIRWNRRIYKERNRIEHMIGHYKTNRATATRYDKLVNSLLDILHIADLCRCLRLASL